MEVGAMVGLEVVGLDDDGLDNIGLAVGSRAGRGRR